MRHCVGNLGLNLPDALLSELSNAVFHQMRDWELKNIRATLLHLDRRAAEEPHNWP